jgi:hypothetical protein
MQLTGPIVSLWSFGSFDAGMIKRHSQTRPIVV